MSGARVIVVLPAYNEGRVIAHVVAELREHWPEVVVVDDGSADDTAGQARGAGAFVVRHAVNRGQGAALQTGITLALRRGASCIVTFDSDGQHRAEDVGRLVAPIAGGIADVALGTRFAGAQAAVPAGRRLLLRAATRFTRLVSRVDVSDAHNGLRALSRRAALGIAITMDRKAHASELIDQVRRGGFVFVEVPVTVRYTEYSRFKGQRGASAWRILLDYLLGRLFG
jgi:glycosyltransferase involved in cell wall biosynthesis